jgi:hypothetical protein
VTETDVSKKLKELSQRFQKRMEGQRKFTASRPFLELKKKKKIAKFGSALIQQEEANTVILSLLAEELTLLRRDMQIMLKAIHALARQAASEQKMTQAPSKNKEKSHSNP